VEVLKQNAPKIQAEMRSRVSSVSTPPRPDSQAFTAPIRDSIDLDAEYRKAKAELVQKEATVQQLQNQLVALAASFQQVTAQRQEDQRRVAQLEAQLAAKETEANQLKQFMEKGDNTLELAKQLQLQSQQVATLQAAIEKPQQPNPSEEQAAVIAGSFLTLILALMFLFVCF
jgi:chromosome segregation ATPase